MFGLTGAHRSGKSTLAKLVAEKKGIPYLDISATRLMKEAGFDPVAPMDIDRRIEAQVASMKVLRQHLADAPRPFISDRTPLDFVAYMLGEISMHKLGRDHDSAVVKYVNDGVELTNSTFAMLMITRPLPQYDAQPGKPPPMIAYQFHIQTIIEGLTAMCAVDTFALLTSDLGERVDTTIEAITEISKELDEDRAKVRLQ